MEQKKKGGFRLGAGRKPVLHKKKQISLYVEGIKILPFGSEDKMKTHLYSVIDNFSKPDADFQDLTKPTNEIKPFEQPKTNYEIKIPPKPISTVMSSFDALKEKILETETIKQVEAVMKEVKVALLNMKQKQVLEQIAKEHSKEFFSD